MCQARHRVRMAAEYHQRLALAEESLAIGGIPPRGLLRIRECLVGLPQLKSASRPVGKEHREKRAMCVRSLVISRGGSFKCSRVTTGSLTESASPKVLVADIPVFLRSGSFPSTIRDRRSVIGLF